MKANDILIILHEYHKTWIMIANYLLYKDDEQAVQDIVQDMYLKIYDSIKNNEIEYELVIVNDKPHFGVIKRIIQQIIQRNANNDNLLPKDENYILNNIIEDNEENIEDKMTRVNETLKEVDKILNEMYWFDRKLFKLYVDDFNSIRELAKETKLGHVTVYKTIKKCRINIKKKLNEK